jgi:acetate kinase
MPAPFETASTKHSHGAGGLGHSLRWVKNMGIRRGYHGASHDYISGEIAAKRRGLTAEQLPFGLQQLGRAFRTARARM